MENFEGLNSLGSANRIYIKSNDGLLNFEGLSSLDSIGIELEVSENNLLNNFTGLDNLSCIDGILKIYNNSSLSSLSGLENLTATTSGIYIEKNTSLTDITSLINLTSVGGMLWFEYNTALTSLSGLDSICADSIVSINFRQNTLLSTCAIKSICDYIASPNADVRILDNAPGCNSESEVEAACITGVSEINIQSVYTLYPNPAKTELFIVDKNGINPREVTVYNQLGQLVLHCTQQPGSINISSLEKGIYIVELASDNFSTREKLIIN